MTNVILKRYDYTGFVAVFAGSESEAVAVGNGFYRNPRDNSDDPNLHRDIQSRNAITHAHMSASLTVDYGPDFANTLGNIKEGTPKIIDSNDEYRDQYNNEVGRRVGDYFEQWVTQEGQAGRTYTDQQKQDFLDDLIMDAYNKGDLIWDLDHDPRILNRDNTPKDDPTWSRPSQDWEGTSAPRDHSMVDDFSENPIGFTLDIPQQLLDNAQELLNDAFDSLKDLLDALGVLPEPSPPPWVPHALDPITNTPGTRVLQGSGCPLVIDLDGDGVSLIALEDSHAAFDLRGDGFAERTAWVAPTDGLLVRDVNGNGTIDTVSELFGSDRLLEAMINTDFQTLATTENGFATLALLDSNLDGMISSADTAWATLSVWQDANSNGVTEAGKVA